jgi:integrase
MFPHGQVIRYLDYHQTLRFFSVITHPRDRALFATIYQYGLRVSEAALLKLEDVDFARSRIVIRRVKHGLGGERPLFNATARLLEAYLPLRLPTGDGLFTGRQGNLSRKRMQQLFKQYAQRADLGPHVSVHSLRHSIATHLLDAGQGIEFVQDHLGHVNIQNTLIYARLSDRRRADVFRQLEHSAEIVHVSLSGHAP